MLVFPAVLDGPLDLSQRLAWLGVSLALAVLTYYTVENRVRYNQKLARAPTRGIALGAFLTIVVVVSAGTLRSAATNALALPPQADFSAARSDLPAIYRDGCHLSYEGVSSPACIYGNPSAGRTMVLVGDSHAAHWFPALERIALDTGWRLISLTKSACPAVEVQLLNTALARPYEECTAWRADALGRIARDRPALVVIASSEIYLHDPRQRIDAAAWRVGMTKTLAQIRRAGAGAVVLHDTPRPGFDVPVCLSRAAWRKSGDPCDFAREQQNPEILKAERAAVGMTDRVLLVDLSNVICAGPRCPATVDGWVAYRDGNHLTTAMSRGMAPALSARVNAAFPELWPVQVVGSAAGSSSTTRRAQAM
jgi:hypothetical protein